MENCQLRKQLVLPRKYSSQFLSGLHNDLGHPGRERTASLVKERFYWPGYLAEVGSWVENCQRCQRGKLTKNMTSPMVNIKSNYPLELVCTDFLKVDECRGGVRNILVITDHFTKFSVAVATKNQTARTTAEVLMNHFVYPYGIPTKLLSDQGPNFESQVIKELCGLMGIEKVKTTVYHPMGNGIAERFNRSLIGMLRTLEPERKQNWKKFLPSLVFSYNAIKHNSTGFSPFELMFGRKPRLPVDSLFHLDRDDVISTEYVKELREKMQTSHEMRLLRRQYREPKRSRKCTMTERLKR